MDPTIAINISMVKYNILVSPEQIDTIKEALYLYVTKPLSEPIPKRFIIAAALYNVLGNQTAGYGLLSKTSLTDLTEQ